MVNFRVISPLIFTQSISSPFERVANLKKASQDEQETKNDQGNPDDRPDHGQADNHANDHEYQPQNGCHQPACQGDDTRYQFP